MGKQLGLYLLPKDELYFLSYLSDNNETSFYKDISDKQLDEITVEQIIDSDVRKVIFGNSIFGSLNSYIRKHDVLRYDEFSGSMVDTGKVTFRIDEANAPVIEYIRSFIRKDGKLVAGRIWAEMYSAGEERLVYKGDDFKNWYQEISKWLKKNMKQVKGVEGYLGNDAYVWYSRGGELY